MEDYIEKLKESVYQHAHPEKQAAMAKYMRNQFSFLGIQSQERRKLVQEHIKSHGKLSAKTDGKAIICRLWQEEEREFQYAAVDLIERGYLFQKEDLLLLEHLITHKSWWDTVDRIAPNLLPVYYRMYPERKEQQLRLGAVQIIYGSGVQLSFSSSKPRKKQMPGSFSLLSMRILSVMNFSLIKQPAGL